MPEKSSLPSGNIFPKIISLGISSGDQGVWKHLGRPNRNQSPLQNENSLEKQSHKSSIASCTHFTAQHSTCPWNRAQSFWEPTAFICWVNPAANSNSKMTACQSASDISKCNIWVAPSNPDSSYASHQTKWGIISERPKKLHLWWQTELPPFLPSMF